MRVYFRLVERMELIEIHIKSIGKIVVVPGQHIVRER